MTGPTCPVCNVRDGEVEHGDEMLCPTCDRNHQLAMGDGYSGDGQDLYDPDQSNSLTDAAVPLDDAYFDIEARIAGQLADDRHPPTSQTDIPEVVDEYGLFNKGQLRHATFRAEVTDRVAIATGPGGTLWHYRAGVWLDDGIAQIKQVSRMLLGQKFRKNHVEGLLYDLSSDEQFISDEPPTQFINCRNGLLAWELGDLLGHTALVPSTYQLAVDWNPDAVCPTVDAWLAQVIPDDCLDLVWEIIGTAVYADQPFHRAVLLLGTGRNGKGTLLRLIEKLIGAQHVSAITLQQLGEDRFAKALLFGKVANIAGDLDARSLQRTDVFKMATGGDLISAEHKYGQPFQFRNRATFLFSANEAPGTADQTDGFFARWIVVPFNRMRLEPGDEDPTLEARMHLELEGVLVKAVDGLCRAMARGGYDIPASVAEAQLDYRENADPVRRFIAETYTVTGDHDDRVSRHDLYGDYKAWCETNTHRPKPTNRFWSHLASVDPRLNYTTVQGSRLVSGLVKMSSDLL